MKKIFGKKQILLSALIIALGAAVYLNYYFSSQDNNTLLSTGASVTQSASANVTEPTKNLGESIFVNGGTAEESDDYFVNARSNRTSSREEATELLSEMLNNVKATDAEKQEAVLQTAAIAQAIEQESKIESLIKAKEFKDCVVYIEGANCSVVVRSESLTPAQVLQITEIIATQSSVPSANVNIIPVK